MIGRIKGTLIEASVSEATVDVNGIGLVVFIPSSTYDGLPELGKSVSLHTWLGVREDALDLYGFATPEEKEMFLMLRTVSGVGPKLALSTLSSMNVQNLRSAVARSDVDTLKTIKGLGKKTAERIVLELKNKVDAIQPGASPTNDVSTDVVEEAVMALVQLGMPRDKAANAVRSSIDTLPKDSTPSAEALIKLAFSPPRG